MTLNREPATVITAISALAASSLKALVLLGILTLTGEQLAAVGLVLDNFLAVVSLLLIRSLVTPIAAPTLPTGRNVLVTDVTAAGKTEVVGMSTV